uniref:RXLR phytopathogen effector protein WY-domain domain-containing protein n=1 Tax=Peronospora matthiolae TaxID=2874970 RepID=A0AAV1UJX6_9STRA
MRSLCYVLMAVVIHGWKRNQLIAADSTRTNLTAHHSSDDVPHTMNQMAVASRLEKPHGSALDKPDLQGQTNEDRASAGSILTDLALKVAETIVNIGPFKLKSIQDAVKHKKVKKTFEQGTVMDQNKFVSLLVDEFSVQKPRWYYGELIDYMLKYVTRNGEEVRRVQPEELMEAFHSLRAIPDMKDHADRLQVMLLRKHVPTLWEPLIALWVKSRLTPEDVSGIWTAGKRGDFLKVYRENDVGDSYLTAQNLIAEYIKEYEKVNPESDRAAHKELLKYYTNQQQAILQARAFKLDQIMTHHMS